jgi:hypothetical protein
LAIRRKMSQVLSVFLKRQKCEQNSDAQNAIWGCVLSLALGYTTQICVFEVCQMLCKEKQNTQCKYCNYTITCSVPARLLCKTLTYGYMSYQSVCIAQKLIIGLIIHMYCWATYKKVYLEFSTITETQTQGSFDCETLVSVIS